MRKNQTILKVFFTLLLLHACSSSSTQKEPHPEDSQTHAQQDHQRLYIPRFDRF